MKLVWAALVLAGWAAAQPVTFGVLADVQYADKDTAGRRAYRAALPRLEEFVADLNRRSLDFVIQLGDLVDGGAENYARAMAVFNHIRAKKYHVRGNHDAEFAKPGWYDFTVRGWRFLVLDGMDLSVADPAGRAMLAGLTGKPNAQEWNGGAGPKQLQWLERTLGEVDRRGRRVAVFCHFPVLEAAATPAHLLWNAAEVLATLERHRSVAAYICGHDHRGGRAQPDGVLHLTLPGMVEGAGYEVLEAGRTLRSVR
ncbi:MAG: metallophosphoesterase [Bryobacteraceae bacterium]